MQPSPSAGTVRLPSVRVRMPSSCPDPLRHNRFSALPGSNHLAQASLRQRTQRGGPCCDVRAVNPRGVPMNRSLRRVLAVGGLSVVTAAVLATPAAQAAPLAPVQDFLADQ